MTIPLPWNEKRRLQALREILIIDTPPEERFDRISALALREFDAPIALISIVDENRLWFKSCAGILVGETPRDRSFCGHAITTASTMLVQDASEDPRFADYSWVVGKPFVRSYAGALLHLKDGHNAGTLCIMDHRPRTFDQLDLAILHSLRDLVVDEMTRRREITMSQSRTLLKTSGLNSV